MSEQYADKSPLDHTAPMWVRKGTALYRRTCVALFLAGFATFSLLYCVQPLLEEFATTYGVSAAESSLPLSLSMGALAVSIFLAGVLSASLGRRGMMFFAISGAALLNIAAAYVPGWSGLLWTRTIEGLVLGGVPAVAMAYIAEEVDPDGLGLTMGLYVGGTAAGGMFGRMLSGFLSGVFSWQIALIAVGVVGLLCAIGFMLLVPPSRNFTRVQGINLPHHLAAWHRHLTHPGLPFLFLIGGLILGGFVTFYNYADFYLAAPPFALSSAESSAIYAVFICGVFGSSFAGGLSDKYGRGPVLVLCLLTMMSGVSVTLLPALPWVVFGAALLTFGLFATHSVASSWVGGLAGDAKGHASSLYLLGYYMGASVLGPVGGWFWMTAGWPAVVALILGLYGVALTFGLIVQARCGRRPVKTVPQPCE